ncbi:interferon regulatory factor 5-like [Branchiostoma lanceolatum]|uniref:interferon regulatory factor 5-like n=1 Tax=Branchiostoma lanceolatum TaxID=7740 RepID=UPI003453834E
MAGPSRQQLPDFLLGRIGRRAYPGLAWQGPGRTVFSVPWTRFDGENFELNRDTTLFKLLQEWETNQGRPVNPPNPTKWKARLRNAIARSREIEEVSDQTREEGGQPCRVYRFIDHAPLPSILVSVFYRGVEVTLHPLETDCWVVYPPALSPHEQQQVLQTLPPDVALLKLPSPVVPDDPINQVLSNFRQGIFLYVSAGCVYAVRRCAARVYWRRSDSPDVENVLQRDETVQILDCAGAGGDVQTLSVDLSVGQSFMCYGLVVVVVTATR